MANELNLEVACKQVIGVSSRRYRQLAADNIVPPITKGEIDILKACKAMLEYYRKLIAGTGSLSLTDERIRLTKINADQKQLNYDKDRGKLIHVDIAMFLWGQVLMRVRQKILAVPVKLPPLIIGEDSITIMKEVIENFMHEVLTELSDVDLTKQGVRKKSTRSVKRSAGNTKASAPSHRKPVGRKRKTVKPGSKRGARKVV